MAYSSMYGQARPNVRLFDTREYCRKTNRDVKQHRPNSRLAGWSSESPYDFRDKIIEVFPDRVVIHSSAAELVAITFHKMENTPPST
jgi:hypothetical protein